VSLGYIIWLLITIYIWIIVIAALISWVSPNRNSPFVRLLDKLTNPALGFTRRIVRLTFGGLDFTPLLLILVLYFLAELTRLSCFYIGHGAQPLVILPLIVFCLVNMIKSLCWFLFILMIARILMSLIQPNPYNPLVLITYGATEPLLSPLKGVVPKGPSNLDLRAVLFLAFLLLFDVFVLNNIMEVTSRWAARYGAIA
jgi:YggT family protein